jgi:hypothetical protein
MAFQKKFKLQYIYIYIYIYIWKKISPETTDTEMRGTIIYVVTSNQLNWLKYTVSWKSLVPVRGGEIAFVIQNCEGKLFRFKHITRGNHWCTFVLLYSFPIFRSVEILAFRKHKVFSLGGWTPAVAVILSKTAHCGKPRGRYTELRTSWVLLWN